MLHSVGTASIHILQSLLSPAIFLSSVTPILFFLCYLLSTTQITFPWSSSGSFIPSGPIICLGFLSPPISIKCLNHFSCFILNLPSKANCPNSSIFPFFALYHLVFSTRFEGSKFEILLREGNHFSCFIFNLPSKSNCHNSLIFPFFTLYHLVFSTRFEGSKFEILLREGNLPFTCVISNDPLVYRDSVVTIQNLSCLLQEDRTKNENIN